MCLPDHRYYYSINEVQKIFEAQGYKTMEKKTLQTGRLIPDLKGALYNQTRENLSIFRHIFPQIESDLEQLKTQTNLIQAIEKKIEQLNLGTESYLVFTKQDQTE